VVHAHTTRNRWTRLLGLTAVGAGALALAMTPTVASAQGSAAGAGQVTSNTYSASAGSGPAPSDSGPTVDPLRYDCTYPSAGGGCDHVGLTHGYYNGSTVNFLYTANYYCDTSVSAASSTGCEAGAKYTKLPPSATSQDPLYILVPIGFTPSGLQCAEKGNCIDHPDATDLSRLASTLDPLLHTTPSQLDNVPLSPHDHFITTRNNNLPEWWNVNVVGVTNPASYNKAVAAKSYSALQAMEGQAGTGVTAAIPTNIFLYFQTLAGTDGAALDAYHGTSGVGMNPASTGMATDPLINDCSSQAACSAAGVGLTEGYLGSATGDILYTENYFCDKSVSAMSSTGCEAGAPYSKLPPGTSSASETDPLYIITPLFSPAPTNLQCPNTGYCIDHPGSVDLSRLSSVLDPILHTMPSQLDNAPLSPHSHVVLTANNYQPEWWNVKVVGVTNPTAYNEIINSSNKYQEFTTLAANKASGVTAPIPTNIFLWFQVLPGAVPSGAPATGGGSTAGFQHTDLAIGGGAASLVGLVLAAGALARRRRRMAAA
jgi:hypothetical protein